MLLNMSVFNIIDTLYQIYLNNAQPVVVERTWYGLNTDLVQTF
jgi:hypothetical protein